MEVRRPYIDAVPTQRCNMPNLAASCQRNGTTRPDTTIVSHAEVSLLRDWTQDLYGKSLTAFQFPYNQQKEGNGTTNH